MDLEQFLDIAWDLEHAGLVWVPEIGDEISQKKNPIRIAILVDPQGMSPSELRSAYLWLPTVEQLVFQFEARQAILFHAGLQMASTHYCYKTVIESPKCHIESEAADLRTALAMSLRDLLLTENEAVH